MSPQPLPPGLGESFSVGEAHVKGVTRSRTRARDLEAPFHGVRRRAGAEIALSEAPLARDRATRERVLRDARALAQVTPSHAFFTGRTAAVLLGLPLDAGDALDVGTFLPQRGVRRPGVHGRRLTPGYASVRFEDGIRMSSPASTWAMLGGELDERELVRLGDAIVRIPRDRSGAHRPELQLATPGELRAALDAGRRAGAERLRGALTRIRVGSMSPLETDARLEVADAGLPEPELDVEIRAARSGRLLGIADARFPEYRVLLEVEGDHHRTDRRQWARDIEKHAAYAAEGYETVRVTGVQVRECPAQAIALIRAALLRGGWC